MKKLNFVVSMLVVTVLTFASFATAPSVAAGVDSPNSEDVPDCAKPTVEPHLQGQESLNLTGVLWVDSARYQALADLYAQESALAQRALDASTARYRGLAVRASAIQRRASSATVARYSGLAANFAMRARENAHLANSATAARYHSLAVKYAIAASENAQRVNHATAARYNELTQNFYGICESC